MKTGSVPISVVAKVYGKDANWVRAGLIFGWLPIGIATRDGKRITTKEEWQSKKGRINYYISPLKLYQETGYMWGGEYEGIKIMNSSSVIFGGCQDGDSVVEKAILEMDS